MWVYESLTSLQSTADLKILWFTRADQTYHLMHNNCVHFVKLTQWPHFSTTSATRIWAFIWEFILYDPEVLEQASLSLSSCILSILAYTTCGTLHKFIFLFADAFWHCLEFHWRSRLHKWKKKNILNKVQPFCDFTNCLKGFIYCTVSWRFCYSSIN